MSATSCMKPSAHEANPRTVNVSSAGTLRQHQRIPARNQKRGDRRDFTPNYCLKTSSPCLTSLTCLAGKLGDRKHGNMGTDGMFPKLWLKNKFGRWPGQVSHFWFSRDGLCPIQAASVAAWVGKHKGSPSLKRTPSGSWLPRPLIAKNAMNGARFRLRNDRDTCPVGPSGFVVRGLPLIHDKTVDEWGTEVLGYFMSGPPAAGVEGTSRPSPSFPVSHRIEREAHRLIAQLLRIPRSTVSHPTDSGG